MKTSIFYDFGSDLQKKRSIQKRSILWVPSNFRWFIRFAIVFQTCPLFGQRKNGRPNLNDVV